MNLFHNNLSKTLPDPRESLLSRPLACLFAGLLLLCATGCQSAPGPTLAPSDSATPTDVTLNPGDVLQINFVGSSDISQTQKIRVDGKISLPMVGEVMAAGKTVESLQQDLETLYKPQLQNSEVVVSLASGGMPVIVSGAVKEPGPQVFERPTTVFQVIEEAGGVTQYGDLKNVHLVRLENGTQRTYILNLYPTVSGKTTSPCYVREGDVILVPERFFTL